MKIYAQTVKWVFIFYSLILASVCQAIAPNDFAYGMDIKLPVASKLYKIVLPANIYNNLKQENLSDVRVFNANNEPVPAIIQDIPSNQIPAETDLPFFTVKISEYSDNNNFTLHVERNARGSIIDVKSSDSNLTPTNSRLVYLIDAASIQKESVQSLLLFWDQTEGEGNWINDAKLSASNDLHNWTDLVPSSSIAQLERNGHNITQNSIEIADNIHYKYLLLQWNSTLQPLVLNKIVAKSVTTFPTQMQWLDLPITTSDSRQDYLFEKPQGLAAIDTLKFSTSSKDFTAKVKIFSRSEKEKSWEFLNEATIYDLSVYGKQLSKLIADVTRYNNNHYWKISFDRSSNTNLRSLKIATSVKPKQLVFVASGEQPFVLAYGSTRVNYIDSASETVLQQFDRDEDIATAIEATLGDQHILGGVSAINPTYTQFTFRLIYWALLLIGVIFLGYIAYSLIKQIKAK